MQRLEEKTLAEESCQLSGVWCLILQLSRHEKGILHYDIIIFWDGSNASGRILLKSKCTIYISFPVSFGSAQWKDGSNVVPKKKFLAFLIGVQYAEIFQCIRWTSFSTNRHFIFILRGAPTRTPVPASLRFLACSDPGTRYDRTTGFFPNKR